MKHIYKISVGEFEWKISTKIRRHEWEDNIKKPIQYGVKIWTACSRT